MKPLIKLTLIVVAGIGLLGVATGCMHRLAHKSPEEHAAWIVKNIDKELKLNDTQLGKLKDEVLAARRDYR